MTACHHFWPIDGRETREKETVDRKTLAFLSVSLSQVNMQ